MKIRLQVSVAVTFAVLTALVLGLTVSLFFANNRDLAIRTAGDAMADAQQRSEAALVAEVTPVIRVVATAARFAGDFPDEIGTRRGFDMLAAEFEALAHVYGVFVALDADGQFAQVARIAPGTAVFGPDKVPVPEGAVLVHRLVGGSAAARTDRMQFLAADGTVLRTVTRPSTFEPRERPWYADALVDANTVVSPVYVFASSGQPGVTMSNRFAGPDGAVRGVVGVDMSLGTLDDLLAEIRVDGVGEIFLLDRAGRLVASSEAAGGAGQIPVTEAALAQAQSAGRDRRLGAATVQFAMPGVWRGYLLSMAPMAPLLGTVPTLGVIVPTEHYVGGIAATTRRVLAMSAGVGLAAMAAVFLLARLLSQSLRRVSDEARRISAFDLGGQFEMRSRITEVDELGSAVANMKSSLGSFAAYVPKDVVRSLVASGGRVAVGGTSREVTLMFSDIEGFTRKSEALPPEVAMRDLSRYFEVMAAAVAATGGSVDKYIGDAVMAIWNAPGEVADHAAAACRGALACHAAEAALNAQWAGAIFPTHTRIGLHTDRVVVGNVGSADRLQYTAIGGAVNLASRVEGLNKVYGTSILATQAVVDRVAGAFVFREVDLVSPAGTTRPVALHELIGEAGQVDAAVLRDVEAWGAALAAFRRCDWAGAGVAFAALRGGVCGDRLVTLYLDRCAAFAAAPPGDGWNGVTVLNSK